METDKSVANGIWERMTFNSEPPSSSSSVNFSQINQKKNFRSKVFYLVGNILACFVWLYMIINTFIFSIDDYLKSILPHELDFLISYKFFVFLAIMTVLSLFSRKILLLLAYVFFFPLLLLLVKLPILLYGFRSWLVVLGLADIIVGFFVNFRRKIILTAITLFSMLTILTVSSQFLMVLSACAMIFMLVYSLISTVFTSFKTSRFFKQQFKTIKYIVNSKFFDGVTLMDKSLKHKNKETKYSVEETNKIVSTVQLSLLGQRLLYFWAYQLEKYSASNSSFLLNSLSYMWLALKTVIFITFINIAIFNIDNSQFKVTDDFGFLRSMDYSINALFLSETSHAIAQGDIALSFRIASEIIGFLILGFLITNLLVVRAQKRSAELSEIVGLIKQEGKSLEKKFSDEFEITPEEAIFKLADLRNSMLSLIAKVSSQLPDNYYKH